MSSSNTTPIRGNNAAADAASATKGNSANPEAPASPPTVGKNPAKDNATAMSSSSSLNTTSLLLSQSESAAMVPSTTAATSVAANLLPTSVTRERKVALLQQARVDRLQWIRQVPWPYQKPQSSLQHNGNDDNDNAMSSLWSQDERLRQLKNSHAVQQLPTALTVLSHLYGIIPNNNSANDESVVQEIGNRVASIIAAETAASPDEGDDHSTWRALVSTAEPGRPAADDITTTLTLGNGGGGDDPDVLVAYQAFIAHLSDPVCAMLVQGMRSFCRNLKASITTKSSSSSSNDASTNSNNKDQVVRTLQAYLDSTMETIQQQHAAWIQQQQQQHSTSTSTSLNNAARPDYVRRSLDSFIYGQCHDFLVTSLYWNDNAKMKEQEWLERIDSLQFVNPRHLEIAGLGEHDDDPPKEEQGDENNDNHDKYIQQLLQEPIQALLSVNRYHAAFEKLQRILAVYRGVNAALSMALNQNHGHGKSTDDVMDKQQQQQEQQPKRLPSADDVLPTIILTVLKARPERLLLNLQLIEDFLPASHLRAEAGYALTTLHGAVAFIQDLNLQQEDEPASLLLAMNAQEFRQGLEACRKVMGEKRAAIVAAAAASAAGTTRSDPLAAVIDVEPCEVYNIPVREVRAARRRGEVVDMDWALNWQAQQRQQQQTDGENTTTAAGSLYKGTVPTTPTRTTNNIVVDELTDGLPNGFTRNYTFLATRPEDVRMSDLPRLLSEYRMLVHTTESLLAERMAKQAAERKAHRMQRQKELYARARQLDPSLIPSSSNHHHRHQSNGGSPKKTNDRSRDSL